MMRGQKGCTSALMAKPRNAISIVHVTIGKSAT
jgi:hypothetical protein